jgi:hypothetical protein
MVTNSVHINTVTHTTSKYSTNNISVVLTGVVMKSRLFWNITPCSLLKMNRRFGVTAELNTSCWFLVWLFRRPWRWRRHSPPKRLLIFDGLHCVISQKAELFSTSFFYTRKTNISRISKRVHYHCHQMIDPTLNYLTRDRVPSIVWSS